MTKPDFSGMLNKVKTGAGDVAEKVKAGTTGAAEKIRTGSAEAAEKIKAGTMDAAEKINIMVSGMLVTIALKQKLYEIGGHVSYGKIHLPADLRQYNRRGS